MAGAVKGQKDWTGNAKSIYMSLGASNRTERDRETHDFYATDPVAAEWLLKIEDIPIDRPIWECACGLKHLSNVFERHGYQVRSSDLIVRTDGIEQLDFLGLDNTEEWDGTIVTNPPYRYAEEFVEKAISLVGGGNKVCMFLKLQFLEGIQRGELFRRFPPRTVWVTSHRLNTARNGEFGSYNPGAMAFCWFVWEKGYKGETILKWFN